MKKIILLLLFLSELKTVQGQNSPDRVFLSTAGKKYLFYIELNGQDGVLFSLGRWPDVAGTGYSTIYTDTMIKQPDASEFLFAGEKTKIQRSGNKLYLLVQGNHKKIKKLEIDTMSNAGLANTQINHAYWWDSFLRLGNDLKSTFPLYNYSFRNGFACWKSFANTGIYYKDFKIFADNRLKILRDSITAIQTPYVLLTNDVIKNMATIDYTSLKNTISKLPVEYTPQSGYFSAVVNSVCSSRPELFFKLVEDMPASKGMLFDVVDDKETIQKLKAVETPSPAKKDFFKAKREDKAFTVKAILITVAGAALLAFSVISLVK